MKSTVFLIALPILTLGSLMPTASIAGEHCPSVEAGITIKAASANERTLICDGTRQALQLLAQCAIAPQQKIEIQILEDVRHPLAGPIFGYYDLNARRIALTAFPNMPALMQGTPYEGLPHREFYRSLVVHEVVHSVMHQNLRQPAKSHAAYEYPAYALQIASLPADARTRFLKAFDRERLARTPPFSDTILGFAPYLFAARAYEHFVASPNACTNLRAVMTGEIDVPSEN